MCIYEQLEALYKKSGYPPGTMQADIEYYLRTGYVFSTPECFIMGRAISNSGWYVHAAIGIGALEGFLQHVPYYLPYIGWERRGSGKIRWYSTTKLVNKLLRKGNNNEIAKGRRTNTSTASYSRSGG